jgi:hypothetical protein
MDKSVLKNTCFIGSLDPKTADEQNPQNVYGAANTIEAEPLWTRIVPQALTYL